jgi:hypothetical protein
VEDEHGEAWEKNVDAADRWSSAHHGVLSAIGRAFCAEGHWVTAAILQRRLQREGQRVEIIDAVTHMPASLGMVHPTNEVVVLSARGLRDIPEASGLLTDLVAAVELAVVAWLGPDEPPTLNSGDLLEALSSGEAVRRVSMLLLDGVDGFFLGSGSGTPGSDWSREVTDTVRHLEGARTVDDLLSRQAKALWGNLPLDQLTTRLRSGPLGRVSSRRVSAEEVAAQSARRWHPLLDAVGRSFASTPASRGSSAETSSRRTTKRNRIARRCHVVSMT